MDRSRNRLKMGDRVIVLGFTHGGTGVFEPHGTVQHLYPKKAGGVLIRLDRGGDHVADSGHVIHEPKEQTCEG